MKKTIGLPALLACLMPLVVKAQQQSFYKFNQVESICYCAGNSPASVAKLDNNWELLLSLRAPKSIATLDSTGIKYTKSQLRLLEQWKQIKQNKNGSYETLTHIFDKTQTGQLRNYSWQLSQDLLQLIRPAILNLKADLQTINREQNMYTILFSYIIDGMVWEHLEKEALIKKRQLNLSSPIWDGEFWTLFPKREFYCGTNSIADNGYALKVNWSENVIPQMLPFVSRFDLQQRILNDYMQKGKLTDPESKEVFGKFNFFDQEGNFTIPVIVESETNRTYRHSREIASIITAFIKNNIDRPKLVREYGFTDSSQALIILYHEMIWDIMKELERKEVVIKPIAFRTPDLAKPTDIADLIIMVKSNTVSAPQ